MLRKQLPNAAPVQSSEVLSKVLGLHATNLSDLRHGHDVEKLSFSATE